jgi:hypothetical protein
VQRTAIPFGHDYMTFSAKQAYVWPIFWPIIPGRCHGVAWCKN